MGSWSLTHWLIVLAIVILIFGTARLKNVGKDLGDAVKGFKKGLQDEDKPAAKLSDESRRDETAKETQPDKERESR